MSFETLEKMKSLPLPIDRFRPRSMDTISVKKNLIFILSVNFYQVSNSFSLVIFVDLLIYLFKRSLRYENPTSFVRLNIRVSVRPFKT